MNASALPSRRALADDGAGIVDRLRELYAPPEWAVFTEVRSATGTCDAVRYADALAVHLWGGGPLTIHGFEAKASRADFLRERKHPEKSGPIKLHCAAWWLVVRAPWTRVLLKLHELPERWGLLEIGTGAPQVIVRAVEREAEEPTPGFARSLFRAASAAVERAEVAPDGGPPLVPIVRLVSRAQVGLACGHGAPRPLTKALPRELPCFACAQGLPTDRDVVLAALADASGEELQAYRAALAVRGAA